MMRAPTLAAAALLLVACESKPATVTQEQQAPAPPAEGTTPIAKAPEPEIDLESVPVAEDFEEQAATELSAANLEAKLDELEKEIGD